MVLTVDIGNSTTSIGLFDHFGTMVLSGKIPTVLNTTCDDCALKIKGLFDLYQSDMSQISGGILSSVVPAITLEMQQAIQFLIGHKPLLMGAGIKTGINIKSDGHGQMGSDIVATVVAATTKFQSPMIVIDMGTATTLSYMKDNVYEGCVILPGVYLALEALSDGTAGLPHISLETPTSVFGHNTVDAMRIGAIHGHASLIDGMIERLEGEGGKCATIVATGGHAPSILQHCKRAIIHEDNLSLEGLFLIYQKNNQMGQK